MSDGALSGLRVLDMGHHIAGPFCAKLLACLGAEVIKVERPGGGDGVRRIGPFPGDIPHPEKSGLFLYLNTNKKGVTLNLKTKTGVKILQELVKDADILVENFEPRVMSGMGLGYDSLEKVNPRLIMTSISNFGQTGPYRDYKAANLTEMAMGGLMYVTGQADHEPLRTGGSQAEYHGGLNAFVGTLTALYYRDFTGVGQHVDISLMESLVSILEYKTVMYSYQGAIAGRWYSRHPFSWPHGDIYPCKDGYVAIPPQVMWNDFGNWLGRPELGDLKFLSLRSRLEHAGEFDGLLISGLKELTREEVFHRGQEVRFGTGYVANAHDLVRDRHLMERDFFVELDHPEAGKLTYPGLPFKLSETPGRVQRAPLLGEHNVEIYCDRLGYTREDLVRLRETGII
jgi:CoA:oxalate CoA-transferase